jgi:hypothetical protein
MTTPLFQPPSGCHRRSDAAVTRWLAGFIAVFGLVATAPEAAAQGASTVSGIGLYSGVYFGTSENGEGHWAMCVSWKGEGAFDFMGRASDGAPLFRSYPYAEEFYDNGQFRGATPEIYGSIVQGHVTGAGDGRFVGDIDQEDSPSAIYAGLWQWSNTPPYPMVEAIVGPSGKALVAYRTSWTSGEDAMTRVDANGQFAVTLSGGTRVSGRIDVGARRLTVALGDAPLPPAPTGQGQLGNFSLLSALNPAGARIVQQFSVVGKQNKNLLLRAVGAPLAQFRGAGNYLEDPAIEVWDDRSVRVAANDDWASDNPALLTAMQQAGAFPLPPNSRDAAQVFAFPPGDYTFVTRSSSTEATGTVLSEVFDLEPGNSPLAQVVSRGRVERNDALVSGFVISGDQPALVLVRAIGPKLADFGVADALADPQLKIIASNGAIVAQNNDWDPSDAALVTALRRAGGTLRGAEKDAAVLVSLPPGAYVASVQGAGGASGTAQIEISQPQLARTSEAGLAVDVFKVEMRPTSHGDYIYEPQVLVYGTQAANPVFVWAVQFHFVDGGSYPGWSPGHLPLMSVAAGEVADLIPLASFGDRVFEFFTPTPASHVIATIRFRGRDEVEHTLTALTQVTVQR